jgi:hypothetical protein
MNDYIFLIGWLEGSPSASSEKTGIHTADDLLKGLAGNPHVRAYRYKASKKQAHMLGQAAAFQDNYTAEDSISMLLMVVEP